MGCIGYICKGCGTAIRGNCYDGGELCIMKHVRHGEVLGEVVGHYDEYGRVIEEEGKENRFRGEDETDINSHSEICDSEFGMNDSRRSQVEHIYKDKTYDFSLYLLKRKVEIIMAESEKGEAEELAADKLVESHDFFIQCKEEFKKLPVFKRKAKSGIVAWHKKCYDEATEEQRNDLTPSEDDPDQSWGRIRKRFK
jgi:hypothetical protein